MKARSFSKTTIAALAYAAILCMGLPGCSGVLSSPEKSSVVSSPEIPERERRDSRDPIAPKQANVQVSAEEDKEWAPVGDTVNLSARVLDDQGGEVAGATVSWSSSNTNVATVDSSGVMTAVGVGSVTLTATATVPASSTRSSVARRSAAAGSRASGSIDMIVVKRASRVEITPASVSFDGVGVSASARLTGI